LSRPVPPSNALSGSQSGSPKPENAPEYITFTDKSIKYLKSASKRRIIWANGLKGLGIRITPNGTKSFIYKYDHDGRDRWITFGQYPKLSLADALQHYAAAHKKAETGEDPAEEAVEKNEIDRNSLTVKQLANEYIEKYAKPHKRSWKEDKRILDNNVLPPLGTKKANKIKRREIIALLDDIVARDAPIMANRTLSVVRRMFNFAVDKDILEASPCFRIKPPAPNTSKDRYLLLDELKKFWIGLDTTPIDKKTRFGLKLLVLTLQRSNEVLGMHISELDLKNDVWIIPKERTKNKRAHLVPIPPLAKEIIQELLQKTGENGLLFSSSKGKGYTDKTVLARAIARNLKHFDLAKFTPHDLRRTGSTQLAAFKVPRFDRERLLNHTDNTVGAVYDIYEYQDEKTAILSLWNDIIMNIVTIKGSPDINKLKKKFRYSDYLHN